MDFSRVGYDEAMRRAREIVPVLRSRAQKCEDALRLRAQNAFAVSQSREAVETPWSFYGANAIYTRDPLQRGKYANPTL